MIAPEPGMASVINYLITGTLGLILIVGITNPLRVKSHEELLEEANEAHKKKNKHLFAQSRHKDGEIIFRQEELKKAKKEIKELQLFLEKKDKELDRRKKRIRDLEWELQRVRDRARGRR